jgi:hypothetical protein
VAGAQVTPGSIATTLNSARLPFPLFYTDSADHAQGRAALGFPVKTALAIADAPTGRPHLPMGPPNATAAIPV